MSPRLHFWHDCIMVALKCNFILGFTVSHLPNLAIFSLKSSIIQILSSKMSIILGHFGTEARAIFQCELLFTLREFEKSKLGNGHAAATADKWDQKTADWFANAITKNHLENSLTSTSRFTELSSKEFNSLCLQTSNWDLTMEYASKLMNRYVVYWHC